MITSTDGVGVVGLVEENLVFYASIVVVVKWSYTCDIIACNLHTYTHSECMHNCWIFLKSVSWLCDCTKLCKMLALEKIGLRLHVSIYLIYLIHLSINLSSAYLPTYLSNLFKFLGIYKYFKMQNWK